MLYTCLREIDYISFGVGYCIYYPRWAVESLMKVIKSNSAHALFFIHSLLRALTGKKSITMETKQGKKSETPIVKQAYESPKMEVIKMEVEEHVAVLVGSSGPGGTGHDFPFQ